MSSYFSFAFTSDLGSSMNSCFSSKLTSGVCSGFSSGMSSEFNSSISCSELHSDSGSGFTSNSGSGSSFTTDFDSGSGFTTDSGFTSNSDSGSGFTSNSDSGSGFTSDSDSGSDSGFTSDSGSGFPSDSDSGSGFTSDSGFNLAVGAQTDEFTAKSKTILDESSDETAAGNNGNTDLLLNREFLAALSDHLDENINGSLKLNQAFVDLDSVTLAYLSICIELILSRDLSDLLLKTNKTFSHRGVTLVKLNRKTTFNTNGCLRCKHGLGHQIVFGMNQVKHILDPCNLEGREMVAVGLADGE
ncbi:hypothetical protein EUTSA_v10004679mg [Eutrema salsugineum]|uniref:Uncharacterized protein n=1 Tax=Eutrema salsugineum TaxID=72664 RepID=V4MMB9_EUTSA|nr:hypothetical protein EUTSA_v10004679mg [Eutrema salsugineum]